MLEIAVVLPLVLMLTLGIMTASGAYNKRAQLTHAAREGARYGATLPVAQCSGSPNPCGSSNWGGVVQQLVVDRSAGQLTLANVCVALVTGGSGSPVTSSHTTRADGTACFNDGGGDSGYRVQVLVSRPDEKIDAFLVKFPVTLSSRATAKFEQ